MADVVTATFLFTDLVGSTELATRVGPADAERLRLEHFGLLRAVVAAGGGSEVKNLGDGLMVSFTSVGAALNSAVEMQRRLDVRNRREVERLSVRMGISTGEADTEDGDYFGEPVIEAARLCARAEGGQVLVGATVRALAGRRVEHSFVSVGELDLKGLPEPVLTFAVEWEPAEADDGLVPLPDRVARAPSLFGFAGRREESVRIEAARKLAGAGQRQIVLVSGEPGIGKTTLTAHAASAAHADGALVLYGRCDEGLGNAYQPFAEALTHYVQHARFDQLVAHVAEHGGELGRLVPALATRVANLAAVTDADPESERYRLFAAVVGLLRAAAVDQTVVLVLDDLHWADHATLLMLRHLAAAPMGALVVIATYRDSDLVAGDALSETLAVLQRETAVERLALVGLDDIEILDMMATAAGHALDGSGTELAHLVRRETAGNPFFATEILVHLGEIGAIYQDGSGHWVAPGDLNERGLPQSVRQVIGLRVDRLGVDARRVLSQAAVIGRDFDLDLLADVADTDAEVLLDLVEAGVQAGLLDEVANAVERFTFSHALVQHTLYEELSATRRARVHRRIAEALEAKFGSDPGERVGELARHFTAATHASDLGKALDYSRLAGDRALALLAPDEAVRWYSQAIELAGQGVVDQRLSCALLIGLGDAQRQAGSPRYRETLLEAAAIAEVIPDDALLVRAALANNRGSAATAGLIDADTVRVLELALVRVVPESAEHARLLSVLASELDTNEVHVRRIELATAAVEMARRVGHDPTLITALNLGAMSVGDCTQIATVSAWASEAVTIAERLNDPIGQSNALYVTLGAAVERAQVDEAARCTARLGRLAEQMGQPFHSWRAALSQALIAHLVEDLEAAEASADAALEIGLETGQPEAMAAHGGLLLQFRTQQGRVDELIDFFAEVAAGMPDLRVLQIAVALAYCELDRLDDARRVFESFDDGRRADDHGGRAWGMSMSGAAQVMYRLGLRAGAPFVYERLLPYADQVSLAIPATYGAIAAPLAMLATLLERHDEAEDHFATALDVNTRLRSRYWITFTKLEHARMLVVRGRAEDVERASVMLDDVARVAADRGYGRLAQQAGLLSSR